MPRYALKIEYDGGPFAGSQRQAEIASVQGSIEAALARLEPRDHTIAAAGRTDAGVHAWGQVAHCDLDRDWDPFRLSEALNFHLKPAPVAIVACALLFVVQAYETRARERMACFKAFLDNHYVGLVFAVGLLLDRIAIAAL